MNIKFIIPSFLLILLILINNLFLNIAISIIFIIYYYRVFRINIIPIIILVLLFNLSFINLHNEYTIKKIGYIENIKSNYVVVNEGHNKLILYNVAGVELKDVIEYEGKVEEIHSTNNINTFNYKQYAKRNNIKYSVYVKKFKIKAKSNSLDAKVYRYIDSLEEHQKEVLLNIFYKYDTSDNYLLYASGFHLSFIIMLSTKLFKKNRNIISIIISLFYYLLFGFHFFLLRIFLYNFICLVFKYNRYDKLGIFIICTLLINHNYLYEISFIMFLCFSLFSLFNISNNLLIVKRVLMLIAIQLLLFNKVNLLMIFLFKYFIYFGGIILFFSILSLIIPNLIIVVDLFTNLENALFYLSNSGLFIIGSLKYWWIIIYIANYLLLISNKKYHKYIFILLLIYQINIDKLNIFGEVEYIDVGQGDCILINEPLNGEVIMIDAAGKIGRDNAKDIIYPVLESKGIKKIDKLVVTHDDYDHNGAVDRLKELITIDKVYEKCESFNTKFMKFTNLNHFGGVDSNDKSIVLYTSINHLNFLFMGDASKSIEKQIIDEYNQLKIDVLKVGHHGSKTSSDEKFINTINPKISIISAGINNSYNHPNEEVLDILNKNQSYIFNTQFNGSISIYYSPFLNYFKTGNDKFGIIK